MITIYLKDLFESTTVFFWWLTFAVLVLMIVLNIIAIISTHYNDKSYWPRQALRFMILGKNRWWFHLTLLIANILCCALLFGRYHYSPWILALPLISYPLSGIVITWAARLLSIVGWLIAKGIERYLKIFRMNWF